VGFADNAFGRVPVLEGWHAAWPAPVPGRPLMDRLVAETNLLQEYRHQAQAILDTWFRPEVLIPRLRNLYKQIETDLAEDPYPARRITVPSDTSYKDILDSMESFIEKRYALARSQLNSPGDRPQPKRMGPAPNHDGPAPGPPSADAPSDLQAVKVTSSKVELRWTNHSPGAFACIVQRCNGADCADFTNAIGQQGQNVTSAVDSHVRPGETYRYRVYAVIPTSHGPHGTGVSNMLAVRVPSD
jgi:hypothetical protein